MATSQKPRVVVSRSLGPDVMPLLTGRGDIEVDMWPHDDSCDRTWLLEHAKGASGILVMVTDKVDAELLDIAGPALRVVSTMSVGYEHFDTSELSERGVRMGYTPDVLTDAVADLTVMLALMAGRNAGHTFSLVQSGQWPRLHWSPFAFCGPQLSTTSTSPERTVGFLGFGRISQATLTRLVAFGVNHCIYSSRSSSSPSEAQTSRDSALLERLPTLQSLTPVSMDTLAKQSDLLIVLAPGGPETYHLIDEPFLKKMKKNAVLVNAARGTLVDSDALAKALKEGWIWGAGLDVVEGEPNVPGNHPLVNEPRCVTLPHIGSATIEARIGMATLAVNNLLGGVLGQVMPAELTV
ncbi:hypothetical protein BDZ89DRAFT_991671 [Hymenopellis radicata]|nr:hypothetical protein BDZ89DRAFT_991671 [Hymenopellis radicata]